MADNQNTQIHPTTPIKLPYKVLSATITTNDPLTALVLASARSAKRLNPVLGMMLEAYLATPEGRFMAAQQLRKPVHELPVAGKVAEPTANEDSEPVPALSRSRSQGLNLDSLCA